MEKYKEPEFFTKQIDQARRFYFEKSRSKNSRFNVICGGCEQTSLDFKIVREDFPYYSIEFVAKGAGFVKLNNRKYQLKPGTFFSYGPGISQKITSNPDNQMTKYFIDFTGSNVKQIFNKHISPLGTAIDIDRPDIIENILEDMLRHGLSDSPHKSIICSALLEYLLFRLAEITVEGKNSPSGAFATYQTCRENIKKHFVTMNSLGDIAGICAIDHTYLCRLFKRFDTQSPYQYLLSLKMAYAADRFQKSAVLVKEIAKELGFNDPFHFTRAFKRFYGISPLTFKKLKR